MRRQLRTNRQWPFETFQKLKPRLSPEDWSKVRDAAIRLGTHAAEGVVKAGWRLPLTPAASSWRLFRQG
jgi:hypothetical protein